MAYLRAYQYQGDPGFGSFLKKLGKGISKIQPGKVLKKVLPIAAPFIPGVGPVIGAVLGGAASGAVGGIVDRVLTGGGPALPDPFLAPVGGLPGGFLAPVGGRPGVSARGAAMSGAFRARSRRMNVGNVKALRRAIRRAQGFSNLAKSTLQLTRTVRLKSKRRR